MEDIKRDLSFSLTKVKDGWAVAYKVREQGTHGGRKKVQSERYGQTFGSNASLIQATDLILTDFLEGADNEDLTGTLFENLPDPKDEKADEKEKKVAKARARARKGKK